MLSAEEQEEQEAMKKRVVWTEDKEEEKKRAEIRLSTGWKEPNPADQPGYNPQDDLWKFENFPSPARSPIMNRYPSTPNPNEKSAMRLSIPPLSAKEKEAMMKRLAWTEDEEEERKRAEIRLATGWKEPNPADQPGYDPRDDLWNTESWDSPRDESPGNSDWLGRSSGTGSPRSNDSGYTTQRTTPDAPRVYRRVSTNRNDEYSESRHPPGCDPRDDYWSDQYEGDREKYRANYEKMFGKQEPPSYNAYWILPIVTDSLYRLIDGLGRPLVAAPPIICATVLFLMYFHPASAGFITTFILSGSAMANALIVGISIIHPLFYIFNIYNEMYITVSALVHMICSPKGRIQKKWWTVPFMLLLIAMVYMLSAVDYSKSTIREQVCQRYEGSKLQQWGGSIYELPCYVSELRNKSTPTSRQPKVQKTRYTLKDGTEINGEDLEKELRLEREGERMVASLKAAQEASQKAMAPYTSQRTVSNPKTRLSQPLTQLWNAIPEKISVQVSRPTVTNVNKMPLDTSMNIRDKELSRDERGGGIGRFQRSVNLVTILGIAGFFAYAMILPPIIDFRRFR